MNPRKPRPTWKPLRLLPAVLIALVACEGDRHLVGETGLLTNADAAAAQGPDAGATAGEGGPPSPPAASAPVNRVLGISAREAVRRLAVVLWNQPSDAALTAEADAGKIQTSEDVRALALRMLVDPRARMGVGAFYRWWLHHNGDDPISQTNPISSINKDPQLFPEFTPALAADLQQADELFGVHVTLDIDGTLANLYTTPFAFANERLGPLFGLSDLVGTELRKVALDPQERAGILTLPGVLARTSLATRNSISLRGVFVMRRLLCAQVPPPPPDVPALDVANEPSLPAGATLRQRMTSAVRLPHCSACHTLFDPIGFALEGFDPIGRARTLDGSMPVDTRVTFPDAYPQLRGTVSGASELGQVMAQAPQAAACFVQQWLAFALGRPLQSEDDRLAVRALGDQFSQAGFNLQKLIAAVMQSEPFLARASLR